MIRRLALLACLALGTAFAPSACRKPPPDPGNAAPDSSAPLVRTQDRVSLLLRAENARDPSVVRDEDLASPQVEVRRVAARAIARMDNPKASERLLGVLADGDPEVLAWAAYGLGQACEINRDRIVRALIARALSFSQEPTVRPGNLNPWLALSRALGDCGTLEAEKTLAAWLDAPHSRAANAALGLGDIASRHKRIQEESAAELLSAAAGDAARDPLSEAFYPFSRLKVAPPRALEREAEIAKARLSHAESGRVFLVRALGKMGESAIEELTRIAVTTSFSSAERAEATRALTNLGGTKAQQALLKVISALSPANDAVALTGLVGAGYHPLITAIDGLDPSEKIDTAPLRALVGLTTPPKVPAAVLRRLVALRCSAARQLARSDAEDPRLTQCDPDNLGPGAQAKIAVLARNKLLGPRLAVWKSFLDPKHPVRLREAALRLLGSHPEIVESAEILAQALESKDLGLVATAAEIINQNPDRAFLDRAPEPKARNKKAEAPTGRLSDHLAQALGAALQREMPPDAVEVRAELARAAGVLRLEPSRKLLESACRSTNPTLRKAAQEALVSLDGKKVTCAADPPQAQEIASELGHLLTGPVKVQLQTDAGSLQITLDPTHAPVAATRLADLVNKGFFKGIVIHRVVAGYVVQFGDPWADGYGGAGLAPLRCETSPVRFVEGTVGVALGGRDTGSSQIFVTLAQSPHIDGRYAVIGKAEGPWDAIAEGDVIDKASIVQ